MYTIGICLKSLLTRLYIFEQLFKVLLDYKKSTRVMYWICCILFIDYVGLFAASGIWARVHTAPVSVKWFSLCHIAQPWHFTFYEIKHKPLNDSRLGRVDEFRAGGGGVSRPGWVDSGLRGDFIA